MWRLVREGLRFYRSTLLTSWFVGAGIFVLVVTVVSIFGRVRGLSEIARLTTQGPLAILIASLVAGFIVTGTERGESRVRMHVLLPVPIGEVALARVVLPTVLMLLGMFASHVLLAVALAAGGSSPLSQRHFNVDFIGALLLFWLQGALVAREIIEKVRAGRRAAATALGTFLAASLAFVIWLQIVAAKGTAWPAGVIALMDVVLMAGTAFTFARRVDFTK